MRHLRWVWAAGGDRPAGAGAAPGLADRGRSGGPVPFLRVERRYMDHRRAYWPRIWPPAIGAGALVLVLDLALNPSWWLGALIGGTVGAVTVQGRIWIWRRRHPVISIEQWLQDRRNSAMWN